MGTEPRGARRFSVEGSTFKVDGVSAPGKTGRNR
nr:MAG TPA: hypothetical protein [Caudoviricetes sp.]